MSLIRRLLEAHAEGKSKLSFTQYVRHASEDDGPALTYVEISAASESLKFLGNLLIAFAESDESTLHLHPNSAGSGHFASGSNVGIYLAKPSSSGPLS